MVKRSFVLLCVTIASLNAMEYGSRADSLIHIVHLMREIDFAQKALCSDALSIQIPSRWRGINHSELNLIIKRLSEQLHTISKGFTADEMKAAQRIVQGL